LKVGQKLMLQSILLTDDVMKNVVDEVQLKTFTNDPELLKELKKDIQTKLQNNYNIFDKKCIFGFRENLFEVSSSISSSIIITTPFTTVKLEYSEEKDELKMQMDKSRLVITKFSNDHPYSQDLFQYELKESLDFIRASIGIEGYCIGRPGHMLVLGGPGSGKTTFCGSLTEELAISKHQVASLYINCTSLKGKRMDVVKTRFKKAFSQCQQLKPAVLVLDNLDVLAVRNEEDQDTTVSILSLWIKDLLQMINQEETEIMVVAVAESIDTLNQNLYSQKSSFTFLKTVCLRPPNIEEKQNLVKFFLGVFPTCLNPTSLDGFLPCDITLICDRLRYSESDQGNMRKIIESYIPISKWGKHLKPQQHKELSSVGGLKSAKVILEKTVIWPMRYPEIYSSIGIKMAKGVLLYGVPGTGKTLLAESIASFSNINYIQVKGPELLSKYIGSSEQNVRDVFLRAQSAKPCLIFFDEFDSLAPRRGHDSTGVTDRVVNQLLTQMDGVEGLNGVWIIAATSRPDLVDPALLRPGRIDKLVHCPLPSISDREDILIKLTSKLCINKSVDWSEVAKKCPGFSGADLKAVLYTAKRISSLTTLNTKKDFPEAYIPSLPLLRTSKTKKPEDAEITMEILLEALAQTAPSVSTVQIQKYDDVYAKFRDGKTAPSSQRATLA